MRSETPDHKPEKKDKDGQAEQEDDEANQADIKFSPEEEAELVAESNTHKAEANALFTSGKYDAAINKYDEAIAVCPTYLDYPLAVLRSNVAACHLMLEEWKDAVTHATTALNLLDKLEREDKLAAEKEEKEKDEVEEEIVSAGAATAGPAVPVVETEAQIARQRRQEDIARIRAKALLRRARARSELGGWSTLEGAIEDYKKLAVMTNLTATDRKLVQAQLRALPPRAKAAQEKETAEMWGKLKDLGNGLLKPFGLSTDAFKMVKDEKTGGYSLNFGGGGGEAKK
ncbi:hypothetical protein QBC45DRAFT_409576 [Copromyces sp. CBS 386.78]|nr:hypothetical protein QBC45DRAFT_409576 [Copromyces sp. CBS 386.78]